MTIISSVVCPFCGCLCDDIEITVEEGRITKNKNGCSLSQAKFLNYNNENRIKKPLIRINGELKEVSLKEAIQKTALILANAKYPVLYGWSSTSCEAQKIGIQLAEQVGGVFDNTSSLCHGPSVLAMQEVGLPSCTLGQVRHRADLIFYWGSDPLSSHPRHLQRYTYFSEGRYEKSKLQLIPNSKSTATQQETSIEGPKPESSDQTCLVKTPGKKNRKLLVVDVRKTLTAAIADLFLQIEPNRDFEIIQALRTLVKDQEIDVESVAGVSVEYLREVADVLVNCEYGVIFYGMGLAQSMGKNRNIEAAIGLVRDLNMFTKFAIMPMRGHFNVTGADTVLTWQTGYPFAVDFSLGYPRYNPGETTTTEILMRKESDAFLAVASDPVAGFPKAAVKHIVSNPLIVIDPHLNATALMADVVLPSAIVGIEKEGTAYRMDHVPLPLKKIVKAPKGVLDDEEILSRILEEVKNMKSEL